MILSGGDVAFATLGEKIAELTAQRDEARRQVSTLIAERDELGAERDGLAATLAGFAAAQD